MEKITIILYFIALINSIKMDKYYDNNVKLELKSILAKVTALLIDVQLLQQKQQAFESRLSNVPIDGRDDYYKAMTKSIERSIIKDIQSTTSQFAIKKAFLSEKKHLRRMIRKWEQIMDTYAFLRKNLNEKNVEIEAIEEKISQQASITSDLSLQLKLFTETLEVVENVTSLNVERIETMENKVGIIETKSADIEKKLNSSERKVSFYVKYKPQVGSSATLYKKNTAIKFGIVIYNDGKGYDATTGIFTVPIAGVYQFIFFVEGWHQGDTFVCPDAVVALYIDGNLAAGALADPRHDKQFAIGANTYINYLSKGLRVQIGTARTCEQYIIYGYRTPFSGYLLY